MKIEYYRVIETDEYLCIDIDTLPIYIKELGKSQYEGRATVIQNDPKSVCTTTISAEYIEYNCEQVKKSEVSLEYLEMF